MRRMRWPLAMIALLACGGAAHAAAPAPPPFNPCSTNAITNFLTADVTHTGTIDLTFYDASYARVLYYECDGNRLLRLGARRADPKQRGTVFKAAASWSCDPLVRRFGAVAKLPDGKVVFGSYSVRTPSCASRFEIHVPRRVKPGGLVRIHVVDRWGTGAVKPKLCIKPAGARQACRTLSFPSAIAFANRSVRTSRRGTLKIELRIARVRERASVAVGGKAGGAPPPLPTVLAAGDSSMQGVDSFLADELNGVANVVSDTRIGTGISRGVYWTFHAQSQTKRLRQVATVMSVGAAVDAFAIPDALGVDQPCCGDAWIGAYAARVRGIMLTYLRGGRGRVVWMTPPEPRDPERAAITHPINAAIERAATGLKGVQVLRIDKIFSPNGYQEVIRYQGRDVRVREADGVHLNPAGTAIAAKLVAALLGKLG
jgi:hypothetical protein